MFFIRKKITLEFFFFFLFTASDTEFVRGNPNLNDMLNGNRLDEYI